MSVQRTLYEAGSTQTLPERPDPFHLRPSGSISALKRYAPRASAIHFAHPTLEDTSTTAAEAADALGVSAQTIYNYIYAGMLNARHPVNRYILRAGEVAKLAAKRERQRRGSVRTK